MPSSIDAGETTVNLSESDKCHLCNYQPEAISDNMENVKNKDYCHINRNNKILGYIKYDENFVTVSLIIKVRHFVTVDQRENNH